MSTIQSLDEISMIYVDCHGGHHSQPAGDIVSVGTLIDPDDGEDMEMIGWMREDQTPGGPGPYTVTLLLPDYMGDFPQFFTEHTVAASANAAVDQVRRVACASHDIDAENDRLDYMLVNCFPGRHSSVLNK